MEFQKENKIPFIGIICQRFAIAEVEQNINKNNTTVYAKKLA